MDLFVLPVYCQKIVIIRVVFMYVFCLDLWRIGIIKDTSKGNKNVHFSLILLHTVLHCHGSDESTSSTEHI